jgi:hypothetical protein
MLFVVLNVAWCETAIRLEWGQSGRARRVLKTSLMTPFRTFPFGGPTAAGLHLTAGVATANFKGISIRLGKSDG